MDTTEFVRETVCGLSRPVFENLKKNLLGEYISFRMINPEKVTLEILAEKIYDYFNMFEVFMIKTMDKMVKSYMNTWDSLVAPHIAKAPQAKKGDVAPAPVPRARRYYEKALTVRNAKNPTVDQLEDFSRIMMCLYLAVGENAGQPVVNFNFASGCIVPERIMESLRNEEVQTVFPPSRKKRFDTTEPYGGDRGFMIISLLMACRIADGNMEGDT